MKRNKVGFVASIALALVIAVSLLTGVRNVGATCSSPCWHHMSSPNVGSGDNLLTGVFAISDSNVWAVGYDITTTQVAQTLIENYDGTSWSVVSSPNSGSSSYLNGVAGNPNSLLPTDIWAVGYYTTTSVSNTLIEKYHSGSWSTVTSPNPSSSSNVLTAVAGEGNSDYWAVGYDYRSTLGLNTTLIKHYNGSSWSQVGSPNDSGYDSYLTSVTVVSSTLAWAAGYSYHGQLLLKWDGSSWSNHTRDLPSGNAYVATGISFNGLYGWMVGLNPKTPGDEFAFEYNNGWSSNLPSSGSLTAVDTVAYKSAWVVGYGPQGARGLKPQSAYWDGTQWIRYDGEEWGVSGDVFNAVSAIAKNDVWGVGYTLNDVNPDTTFIEQFY